MNEYNYKKENEKCVCVNVFVKCDKKDHCGKDVWEQKEFKKDECCVEVNIFTECDKKDRREPSDC